MGKDGRGDSTGKDALAFAREGSLLSSDGLSSDGLSSEGLPEAGFSGEGSSKKGGPKKGGVERVSGEGRQGDNVKSFDAHLRSRSNPPGRQHGDSSRRRTHSRDASLREGANFRAGSCAGKSESSSRDTAQALRSDVQEGPGPSKMASRIQRLRSSSLKAFETRKRVPHTLFWSLFRSEIEDLRSRKEKARRERELYLSGVEEDSA